MSVASTTERPSGGSPPPFPGLSDCPPANVTNSREPDRAGRVAPLGRQPARPSAWTFGGRSAAKTQMTHSRPLAKELLTWPPTDPQNMLDPNTLPSVKSSPAGFPEPTCRGHAGGSAQPGPMGRNSHPDWSGLTFSMALFLVLFSFPKPEIHFQVSFPCQKWRWRCSRCPLELILVTLWC